jgi:hypothetical protein
MLFAQRMFGDDEFPKEKTHDTIDTCDVTESYWFCGKVNLLAKMLDQLCVRHGLARQKASWICCAFVRNPLSLGIVRIGKLLTFDGAQHCENNGSW